VKIIEFNGIVFSSKSKYIFHKFETNTGDTEYQASSYINQDGIDIRNITYTQRVVKLEGHILANTKVEFDELKKALIKACNGKTKANLYYTNDYEKYYSECIADIPQFGEYMYTVQPFSITFTLYNFYWKSLKTFNYDVFKRTDLVIGTFTLPCVFTSRVNTAEIINGGDVEDESVIKITNLSSSAEAEIQIKNNTTSEFIKLNYEMSEGEVITINTEDMTIKNQSGTNLIKYITNDSIFFKLILGINAIEVLNGGNSDITAQLTFNQKYVGVA
jgi:hypothetical protein